MPSRVSFATAKWLRYRSGVYYKCMSFLMPTINVSVTLSMSVELELGIDGICVQNAHTRRPCIDNDWDLLRLASIKINVQQISVSSHNHVI